jgi:hypothetical protein
MEAFRSEGDTGSLPGLLGALMLVGFAGRCELAWMAVLTLAMLPEKTEGRRARRRANWRRTHRSACFPTYPPAANLFGTA